MSGLKVKEKAELPLRKLLAGSAIALIGIGIPSAASAACFYPNVTGQGPEAVLAAQQAYQACVNAEFQQQQQQQQQWQQQQQMREMQRQQQEMQRQQQEMQRQLQRQQMQQQMQRPNGFGW